MRSGWWERSAGDIRLAVGGERVRRRRMVTTVGGCNTIPAAEGVCRAAGYRPAVEQADRYHAVSMTEQLAHAVQRWTTHSCPPPLSPPPQCCSIVRRPPIHTQTGPYWQSIDTLSPRARVGLPQSSEVVNAGLWTWSLMPK